MFRFIYRRTYVSEENIPPLVLDETMINNASKSAGFLTLSDNVPTKRRTSNMSQLVPWDVTLNRGSWRERSQSVKPSNFGSVDVCGEI